MELALSRADGTAQAWNEVYMKLNSVDLSFLRFLNIICSWRFQHFGLPSFPLSSFENQLVSELGMLESF